MSTCITACLSLLPGFLSAAGVVGGGVVCGVVCAPRRKAAPSWGYGQAVVLPPCCQPWLHWSRSAPLAPLVGAMLLRLLCLPEAHGTSKVATKVSVIAPHVALSCAACIQSSPAVSVSLARHQPAVAVGLRSHRCRPAEPPAGRRVVLRPSRSGRSLPTPFPHPQVSRHSVFRPASVWAGRP